MMIKNQLNDILLQISQAEQRYARLSGDVLLLAVSKMKSAQAIAEAYQAGQRHFGENYCQEALGKQKELGAYDITWHFIGPIQSNKTKLIANHFSWVHSVDSFRIAQRLSDQRANTLPPLNICLQININDEQTKSGIRLAELAELTQSVAALPNLILRGVMAVPEPELDFEKQRQPFKALRAAVVALNNPVLDTFSFGMSADLNAAIAEGSTIVRIGTALFGARA